MRDTYLVTAPVVLLALVVTTLVPGLIQPVAAVILTVTHLGHVNMSVLHSSFFSCDKVKIIIKIVHKKELQDLNGLAL